MEHHLASVRLSTSIKNSSKLRIETAAKALDKTWPEFPSTNVRQITATQCKQWALRAQTEGTKFIPRFAKGKPQKGMSPSAFNQTLSVLRSVFALAVKLGLIYVDPSEELSRMSCDLFAPQLAPTQSALVMFNRKHASDLPLFASQLGFVPECLTNRELYNLYGLKSLKPFFTTGRPS